MIHHVTMPARNPEHVAQVLAEVMGGTARPFLGPVQGAFNVMLEDGHGTAIEIIPDGTVMVPGQDEVPCSFGRGENPTLVPFHFLISVETDRETIERIGEREGWRTRHFWRGPVGKGVQLIEFWVENRFQIEFMTPEMVPAYVHFEKVATQDAMRDAMAAHWAGAAEK